MNTPDPMLRLLSAIFILCSAAADAPPAPNILLIVTDYHTTQALSAYGEARKLIETPNIDRIGREGMVFDRCMVPKPICGPSRASILTGKYSHRHGFYNNETQPFDGSQTTFPKLLRAAGYQTAVIGKWHLGSAPTGFDHWHILPGQGVYYNPPMILNGSKTRHQGYVTDIITRLTIDWLRGRDKSRPFMLMSQHKAPHREWAPALRHLGWDDDRRYPEPPTLFDPYDGNRGRAWREQDMSLETSFQPRDFKLTPPSSLDAAQLAAWNAYYQPRNQAMREAALEGRDLVRWKYNRYMHDYLGTIKAVDEGVGELLDFLDAEGLADNTVVIYASDQGFFLGEHGWFDKRWILEESARTPLLIRWPCVTKPGSREGKITSVIDWA